MRQDIVFDLGGRDDLSPKAKTKVLKHPFRFRMQSLKFSGSLCLFRQIYAKFNASGARNEGGIGFHSLYDSGLAVGLCQKVDMLNAKFLKNGCELWLERYNMASNKRFSQRFRGFSLVIFPGRSRHGSRGVNADTFT
jgi:hypothetical protein